MFLSQTDGCFSSSAQIVGELFQEIDGNSIVLGDNLLGNRQGDAKKGSLLKSTCFGDVMLTHKRSTIAKELFGLDHAHDLMSASNTFLVNLNLSFDNTEKTIRLITLVVDGLVFLITSYLDKILQ